MKVIMSALLGAAIVTSAGVAQADTVVHRDVVVHRTVHHAPPRRWHPVHHRAQHVVVRKTVVHDRH